MLDGIPSELAELPPLRYYVEYGRRYATRDLDAFIELFDPGWVMVDHRVAGWEQVLGRDACRALTKSVFAVSPDVRFKLDQVLACDQRVIAMRASYNGQSRGGQGEFAVLGGFVTVIENGHSISTDQYEYDDDESLLARFAALSRSGRE